MIVLDANILLYAYDAESAQHRPARTYLEEIFSASDPVGLPLQSISAFLRIMTQQGLRSGCFTLHEAVEIVEEWLNLPQVRLLIPGERHWSIFQRMLIEGHASGRLVTDAQIAATTMEFGGELQTNDRDFARFPGLRWNNPLVKK
ncbi:MULTISPECIES: TA system VapC family ribonuclease toxin [Acidobacteriaceae]|uniref:TA system VapC family ribonuclease toxin n=1 Tax=Acidobacteriaceae TaxID=204434 RepID=UPI00131D8787|nr:MULTISPECIES: TA system VapC family ribonuclease toxin [Acidobacteriaceae]MDW5265693.1 TA system VapC family ribonuclease toxin [Edaphobacter sp.]